MGFDELTHSQKTFLTYSNLKKNEYKQLTDAMKVISNIYCKWYSIKESEQTPETATDLKKSLDPIRISIPKVLAKADVLSRIFLLTDFTTNGG